MGLHVATEATQHQFLKDKPTTVYFTITYTDEYNDEWTTAVTTVDYTSFCLKATGSAKGAICLSTPTINYKSTGTTNAEKNQPTRDTLERIPEHVNASLLALPTRAIPEAYVWSAANSYDVACGTKPKSTRDSSLRLDIKDCIGATDLVLKPRAFMAYPWVQAAPADDPKDRPSKSVYVDSLDFRLDLEVTKQVDQTGKELNFDGTDTESFGLGLFVKLPGPGVSKPLQVRYWYTPASKLEEKDVTYSHV